MPELDRRTFLGSLGALAVPTATPAESVPFAVDFPAYLSRHDIVYLSPPIGGFEGFPLGNGDLAAMMWSRESALHFQVNKNDTWDQPTAEAPMLLRSCGRLSIDFGAPCFEWLYLDDFEARLSLHDAEATYTTRTPFVRIVAKARVQARTNVLIVDCDVEWLGDLAATGSTIRISLERWGSRGIQSWYHIVRRGADAGLGQARAGADANGIWLDESLTGLNFSLACRVVGTAAQSSTTHAHRAELTIAAAPRQRFSVVIAAATSNESADPHAAAQRLARDADPAPLRTAHHTWWADYWRRSFLHIGGTYAENLYWLHLYLMACASQGRYPAVFNAATFTWNHDVRQWITPHHWNIQQAYWSVCGANRADLLRPYLDTYSRLLPKAEAHAAMRGYPGAILWSEGHDYAGRMSFWDRRDMVNNFSPASQIGLLFWNYYLHTGDREFLRTRAYPFIKKAAEFYLQKLQWDPERKEWFIFPSQAYEFDSNQVRSPLTDLAMIRTSFRACLEASRLLGVDEDKRTAWQRVLDQLTPYQYFVSPEGGELVALGQTQEGNLWEFGISEYNMCRATAPAFPAEEVGLGQKGGRLFEAIRRRALRHPEGMLAISPIIAVKARVGLAEEAAADLERTIRRLQHFPQGLFYNIDHWYYLSRYSKIVKDPETLCQRDYVYDRSTAYTEIDVRGTKEKTRLPTEPFIQCGLEPSGLLAAGLHEMLLQSHEGCLRVFPATPAAWPAAFTLLARGGFLVSAHRPAGAATAFVHVNSRLGNRCRIAHPWQSGELVLRDAATQSAVPFTTEADVISFDTAPGKSYLLTRTAAPAAMPTFTGKPNAAPKQFHEATLGKLKDF